MITDSSIFRRFKVGGMYIPDANITTIMSDLSELDIEGVESSIHENVHRFQFLISTLGFSIRDSWYSIYGAILELFSHSESIISLPLCEYLTDLDKNKNNDSEINKIVEYIKNQISFLNNWPLYGVSSETVQKRKLTIDDALCNQSVIDVSCSPPAILIKKKNGPTIAECPITSTMALESMAYYHSRNSVLAYFGGKNDYLEPLLNKKIDKEATWKNITSFSAKELLDQQFIRKMPENFSYPHLFIINNLIKDQIEDDFIDFRFGIINTLAVIASLLASDYYSPASNTLIPNLYARSLKYIVQELFCNNSKEYNVNIFTSADKLRYCLDLTIKNISNNRLQFSSTKLTDRIPELKDIKKESSLYDHIKKSDQLFDSLYKDTTFINDPQNLVTNILKNKLIYIYKDRLFRSDLEKDDRHFLAQFMLFDLIWDRDNFGCFMANQNNSNSNKNNG